MCRPGSINTSDALTHALTLCCSLFGWASSYITYAVGAAAQRLYDNDNGTLDAYGLFWSRVAARFTNTPGVLGACVCACWKGEGGDA